MFGPVFCGWLLADTLAERMHTPTIVVVERQRTTFSELYRHSYFPANDLGSASFEVYTLGGSRSNEH